MRLLSRLFRRRKPRLLGVLLCYNDGDILANSIEALLESGHEIVVWDHGSDDTTPQVLDRYNRYFRERRFIPREVDFYGLYQAMSENLLRSHVASFDWVTWPDQDEIPEGPDRSRPYTSFVEEVLESEHSWVRFHNFNFWFTSADDPAVSDPVKRVRHYALFPDCAPRIRAWRASATNIRVFNHNPPEGTPWPEPFCLRHYPMRDLAQMRRRLEKDRAGLERDGANYHYENMKRAEQRLIIPPSSLHLDDGVSDLDPSPVFNWREIYGHGPSR
ncbi:glycosyltransferase family 2 protein [Acetobacter sp. AN02]|uniref:glycosyltransferase family A protein n=1 Tax=Acetobacter sp. AN02 TaxID=2894186 RepID=UPI002434294A|nr:glycosyltransferase family 2 protein [Acetobacter sp. AN02]MDG6093595.1 glycosyltransferase family 2 protein [Acetobacter sp. AN02]